MWHTRGSGAWLRWLERYCMHFNSAQFPAGQSSKLGFGMLCEFRFDGTRNRTTLSEIHTTSLCIIRRCGRPWSVTYVKELLCVVLRRGSDIGSCRALCGQFIPGNGIASLKCRSGANIDRRRVEPRNGKSVVGKRCHGQPSRRNDGYRRKRRSHREPSRFERVVPRGRIAGSPARPSPAQRTRRVGVIRRIIAGVGIWLARPADFWVHRNELGGLGVVVAPIWVPGPSAVSAGALGTVSAGNTAPTSRL